MQAHKWLRRKEMLKLYEHNPTTEAAGPIFSFGWDSMTITKMLHTVSYTCFSIENLTLYEPMERLSLI